MTTISLLLRYNCYPIDTPNPRGLIWFSDATFPTLKEKQPEEKYPLEETILRIAKCFWIYTYRIHDKILSGPSLNQQKYKSRTQGNKGKETRCNHTVTRSKDIKSRTQPNNKMHKWWRTQLNQIQYIKDSAQTKTMYISRTQYSLIKQCISWTQLSQQKCIIYQGPSPNLQCKKR